MSAHTYIATRVSKSNPAIKALLAKTVKIGVVSPRFISPKFKCIEVLEVPDGYEYEPPYSGDFRVWTAVPGGPVKRVYPSAADGDTVEMESGHIIVVHSTNSGGSVTIYVPPFDAGIMTVAQDAFADGGAKSVKPILSELGKYRDLALAVVEARSETLKSVASGKTDAQLDREIAEFLKTRRVG